MTEDDHSVTEDVERRSSRRTMLLVIGFVLAGFAVGSGFIYVGSLEVANRFNIYGRTNVRPGHRHIFRAWGFSDNPPGPLVGAELVLELEGTDAQTTGVLNDTGATLLALDVPEDVGDSTLTARVTMSVEGETLESGTFEVNVVRPEHAPAAPSVTSQPDSDGDPWLIQLFTPRRLVLPHVENRIFVRVVDASTLAPISGATVAFDVTHGNLAGDVPDPVVTDTFGLATFRITPLDETDWTLTATNPDGVEVQQRRTLYAAPLNLRIEPLVRSVTPGSRLRFRVFSVSSVDHVYADILADGAWLASVRRPFAGDGSVVSWKPQLASPIEPEVVDLVACFSATQCEEANAVAPIVWSMTPLSEAKLARVMASAARLRGGVSPQWIDMALRQLDQGSSKEIRRLVDFLAVAMKVSYEPSVPLLETEPLTDARLDELKASMRTWLNLLAVLLLVAGGLLVAIVVIRSSRPRRRALEALALDDDMDSLLDEDGPAEGRQMLALYLEIAAVVLTILVFAGGVILLLGQL